MHNSFLLLPEHSKKIIEGVKMMSFGKEFKVQGILSSLEAVSKFEIISVLGRGSFGQVYKVKHPSTDDK